jgi:hypothetical protein
VTERFCDDDEEERDPANCQSLDTAALALAPAALALLAWRRLEMRRQKME